LFHNWEEIWNILADLYVLALRCDLARTGTIMVGSGGDRFGFSGKTGETGNIHGEVLHSWPANYLDLGLEILAWHYDKVASFLERLADPDFRDLEGNTLLDDTTLLIGTELGRPAVHGLKSLSYMIAGARRRFRTGVHSFTDRCDVDLYNTVLTGLGIQRRIGNLERYSGELSIIA
jgi:hypothetical protein